MKTTIQISGETLERLKDVKKHPRESYDEQINELLDDSQDDLLTSEEIEDIKQGLEDIKEGRTKPLEQVAKELGIEL